MSKKGTCILGGFTVRCCRSGKANWLDAVQIRESTRDDPNRRREVGIQGRTFLTPCPFEKLTHGQEHQSDKHRGRPHLYSRPRCAFARPVDPTRVHRSDSLHSLQPTKPLTRPKLDPVHLNPKCYCTNCQHPNCTDSSPFLSWPSLYCSQQEKSAFDGQHRSVAR